MLSTAIGLTTEATVSTNIINSINSNQAPCDWFGDGNGKLLKFKIYGSNNTESQMILDTAMKVKNVQIIEIQLA
jgi:hypothetical protein